MLKTTRIITFPKSPVTAYSVVKDIGQYHKFLPWCSASRTFGDTTSKFECEMTIGFGPFSQPYRTDVNCTEPKQIISIATENWLFKRLYSEWNFEPRDIDEGTGAVGKCKAYYRIEFEFSQFLYQKFSSMFLEMVADRTVEAFKSRVAKQENIECWYDDEKQLYLLEPKTEQVAEQNNRIHPRLEFCSAKQISNQMESSPGSSTGQIDVQSPEALDNLLMGANEWQNIQEIVRLTFRALSDVVKSQGITISRLERKLATLRSSYSDLRTDLELSVSKSDLQRCISDLQVQLDPQPLRIELDSKVGRSEFAAAIAQQLTADDLRQFTDPLALQTEVELALQDLTCRIDDFDTRVDTRLAKLPTRKDIDRLNEKIQQRAITVDVKQALDHYVTKDDLAKGLQGMTSLSEVETMIEGKADVQELHAVIGIVGGKADQSCVDDIVATLDEKVSKNEVRLKIVPELAGKVDARQVEASAESLRHEFDHRLNDHSATIDTYIGQFKADLEAFRSSIEQTVSAKEIGQVYSQLSKKVDTETVNELLHVQKSDLDDALETLATETTTNQQRFEDLIYEKVHSIEKQGLKHDNDYKRTEQVLAAFGEQRQSLFDDQAKWVKTVVNQVRTETKKDTTEILKDLDAISGTVQDLMKRKVENSDISDLRAAVTTKTDLTNIQQLVGEQLQELAQSLVQLRDELVGMLTTLEAQTQTALSKRATQTDLQSIAKTRLETTQFELFAKDAATIDSVQQVREELYQLTHHVKSLVRPQELEAHTHTTQNALEDLSKELLLKANIKDMCSLLDMKANIEDVNRVFQEVNREMDGKAGAEMVGAHMKEQALVNEILCAENCTGRWQWKGGELGIGKSVPWQAQATNTCPDNFIWEQGRTSIVAVAPGLYEITLAFYSNHKPTVTIAINGEPILQAIKSGDVSVHNVQPRESQMRINAGNVAGLSMIEYLQLPARARISIAYSGDPTNAEGFVGLRKL